MTLGAPAYLGLLALVPLVVLLHMRRRRVRRVPSTQIWRLVAASAETRPRLTAVRASASLWLQIATVLVAALALAEPRIASSPGAHHVLVLDAGLLAGTRAPGDPATAYEAAWRRWLDDVPAADGRDTLSVWWVGPWTRPVALELQTAAAVRRSLEASSHADAPADWNSAYEALSGHGLADASVTVVAGDVAAAREALSGLGVRDLDVRALASPGYNVELADVSVELQDARAQRWSIQAVARLAGDEGALPEAVTFRVTFLPHGTSVPLPYAEREVRLSMGGEARFTSDLTFPGPGVLEVTVADEDEVQADGAARFVLDPQPPLPKARVVSALGGASPAARLLHATGRFDVAVGESLLPGEELDLVVVEGVPDPFGDGEPGTAAILRLGSAPAAQARDLTAAGPAQAVRWDASHPATSGTDWGAVGGARAVPLETQGEVLVEGSDGPLVVARSTRAGRELVAAYDPTDPRFVESDGFVTFMVDALEWLAPPAAQATACTVGSPCRVPWSIVASGFEAHLEGAPSWRQPPPAGAVVPSRLDEAWVPTRAGLWWVTTGDGEAHPFPVNPVGGALAPAEDGAPAEATGRTSPAFPWRGVVTLLVVAGGLLVLIEGLIAGRRPDAFWRRDALRAPGAAGRRARRAAALHVVAVASCAAAVATAPFLLPSVANWLVVIGEGEDLPATALEAWDASRISEVNLLDDHGAVDLQRAMEEAAARVDPAHALDVLFTSRQPATRADTMRGLGPLLERGAAVHVLDAPAGDEPVDAVAADLLFADTHFDGDAIAVTGLVHASSPMPAQVRILLDGLPIGEWSTGLPAGWSSFATTADLVGGGSKALTLEVVAEGDEVAANDRRERRVEVRSGPRVTVFAGDSERAETFAGALELRGFQVEVKAPHAAGSRPEAYVGNDAVVLMDVAAIDLARAQQDALDAWVREHGGGLALLGGERSFGPGGYLETPLDSLSPLSSKVSRDAPAVAMLFVLDRSGSMQQVVDGVSRLDIAKEATLAANELLGEGSEIAIVVFDEEARVLLPFTDSSARGEIAAALAPLVPGGGTALYPGLTLAADLLAGSDAASKHVVVMTDGLSQPGDIESAVERLVGLEATVSAIAIGTGADVERIRNIARIGRGTAHTTTDFRALPSILAQEAMLLSGDPVVRERVVPLRTGEGADLMAGVPAELPALTGLVETTAKAAASVLLEDGEGRPVLGAWRYGAGRVVSYASQAVGPWSSEWSASPEFAGWWATWLRWVVQPGRSIGVDVEATVVADEVRVDVLATDERGMPLEGLQLAAVAHPVSAEGAPAEGAVVGPVALAEVAPGQYRGHLPARDGYWEIGVADLAGTAEVADTAVVVRSFGTLHGAPRPADPVIDGLVAMTGGERLTPASTWTPPRDVAWVLTPAWRPWVLIALAAWLLFLVQRYAPTWLAPPRLRTRRAPAGSATTWRTRALRLR